MDLQTHFRRLSELLKLEKEEDLRVYREKIQRQPLKKRVEEGYTWYPLVVTKRGYTYGDRAYVIVSRTNELNAPRQFRSGRPVTLFVRESDDKQREKSGVINFVKPDRMKIVFNNQDLPDWLDRGLLGVDLSFDETTYQEMEKAIQRMRTAKGDRTAELRRVLYAQQAPATETLARIELPQLNASQNDAVHAIRSARDVAVVHGPPGTGKTTTLVQAIRQLAKTESTILVCAPSNTAVDLLTERLAAAGLEVLRVGNISRVEESLVQHTLDGKLAAHPDNKTIKKVKVQAAEARRQAKQWKRSRSHGKNRGLLFKEAGELDGWARQLEARLIDQLLATAQVVTCTLVGSTAKVLQGEKFRTVVIDEAAQALEPATLIPISRVSKVVLAGDPFQLPPTVKSNEAARRGFRVTLLERLIEHLPEVNLLTVQYRMHQAIMGFSNEYFYGGQLTAAPAVAGHQLTIDNPHSVEFIDTAGAGFTEQLNEEFQSRYNPEEYLLLREHLYQLLDQFGAREQPPPSLAIISPYREQVIRIREEIAEDERLAPLASRPLVDGDAIRADGLGPKTLIVQTIDGFQGQERDVVYISLVRSNDRGEIGFLSDYRRMNVAMTRARQLLVITGDSATIGVDDFYRAFLDYADRHGAYRTVWEFMR